MEGVFFDVPCGNSDGFGEGIVLGHFWTCQIVFPQREMGGMVSYMGQSVSDVFTRQNLFVASFFSSRSLLRSL